MARMRKHWHIIEDCADFIAIRLIQIIDIQALNPIYLFYKCWYININWNTLAANKPHHTWINRKSINLIETTTFCIRMAICKYIELNIVGR